jgi:hypothetical protein
VDVAGELSQARHIGRVVFHQETRFGNQLPGARSLVRRRAAAHLSQLPLELIGHRIRLIRHLNHRAAPLILFRMRLSVQRPPTV